MNKHRYKPEKVYLRVFPHLLGYLKTASMDAMVLAFAKDCNSPFYATAASARIRDNRDFGLLVTRANRIKWHRIKKKGN
jgi:hypothetical protein